MKDADCIAFLQWALPRLGLRWAGFRKVRRQVCRRISRRIAELDLASVDAYRAYLGANPEEWHVLDALCRITISRFWRDRAVWEALRDEVLPALGSPGSAWSAGCASGEEPYSLVIAAARADVEIVVFATDVDPVLLARAERASYSPSSLRELPAEARDRAFEGHRLRAEYARAVTFVEHDVRDGAPDGPFDLVLCRNLVFTYFASALEAEVGGHLVRALRPGGALVVGAHETPRIAGLEPWLPPRGIWRRCGLTRRLR